MGERDTIRSKKWKSEIYLYMYILYTYTLPHFSSAGTVYIMWVELSVSHFKNVVLEMDVLQFKVNSTN